MITQEVLSVFKLGCLYILFPYYLEALIMHFLPKNKGRKDNETQF